MAVALRHCATRCILTGRNFACGCSSTERLVIRRRESSSLGGQCGRFHSWGLFCTSRKQGRGVNALKASEYSGQSHAVARDEDWFSQNSGFFRASPLVVGAAGAVGVLLNRLAAGIPPVADAGSSQTRADVLSLFLAASLLLTGLSWLSLTPRRNPPVALEGVHCWRLMEGLPEEASRELIWAWDCLYGNTCCRSAILVYHGRCILQAGVMAPAEGADESGAGVAAPVDGAALWNSPLVVTTRGAGRANYLANLALFPARFELLRYLPHDTQAAILLPLGEDDGVLVLGGDTIRGFTPLDQAWIATLSEKVDATLTGALRAADACAGV